MKNVNPAYPKHCPQCGEMMDLLQDCMEIKFYCCVCNHYYSQEVPTVVEKDAC